MTNPDLYAIWASLGISFQVEQEQLSAPEEAILQTIRYGQFPKYRKFFALMLLWLEQYSEYVHVERLLRMIKELPSHELALLGGIFLKIRKTKKDYRFDSLLKKIRKQLGEHSPSFPSLSDHSFFIQRHGLDAEFDEFGMKVAHLNPADKKKVLSEEHILEKNLWLFHRCMFGVNFRADVATVMKLYSPKNGYQAAKLARCSTNAGYNHWRGLMKIGWAQDVLLEKHIP